MRESCQDKIKDCLFHCGYTIKELQDEKKIKQQKIDELESILKKCQEVNDFYATLTISDFNEGITPYDRDNGKRARQLQKELKEYWGKNDV